MNFKKFLPAIILLSVLALTGASCSRCNSGRSTDGESARPETVPADTEAAPAPDSAAMAAARIPEAPAGKPRVLEFSATWCGPCKRQKPIYEEAMKKYGDRIDMLSIDVDENPELADKYHVDAIPTFIFLDDKGKLVGRANFLDADQLDEALGRLVSEKR